MTAMGRPDMASYAAKSFTDLFRSVMSISPLQQLGDDFTAQMDDFIALLEQLAATTIIPPATSTEGSDGSFPLDDLRPTQAYAFKRLSLIERSVELWQRAGIISAVSVFEVLLSDLARVRYKKHPASLTDSDRTLPLKEFLLCQSFQDAIDLAITERIGKITGIGQWREFFLRECKVDIADLTPNQDWNTWVEVLHRRNLFVHNDGVVDAKYLGNLGPDSTLPPLGEELGVTPDYFVQSLDGMLTVGMKLVERCWAHLEKRAADERSEFLHNLVATYVLGRQWRVVAELSSHAATHYSGSEYYEVFRINYWLAMKRLGQWAEVKAEAESFNLEDAEPISALGVLALLEDVNGFVAAVPAAADAGFTIHDFYDWPIFEEVRRDARVVR